MLSCFTFILCGACSLRFHQIQCLLVLHRLGCAIAIIPSFVVVVFLVVLVIVVAIAIHPSIHPSIHLSSSSSLVVRRSLLVARRLLLVAVVWFLRFFFAFWVAFHGPLMLWMASCVTYLQLFLII